MPDPNSTWVKLKAPVKMLRGAVTLLQGGEFSLHKGPHFNIRTERQNFSHGDVTLSIGKQQLYIEKKNKTLLLKYEDDSWYEQRREGTAASTREEEEAEEESDSEGWPKLRILLDNKSKPSACEVRAQGTINVSFTGAASLPFYASCVVANLEKLNLPGAEVGWSQVHGHSLERFGLVFVQPEYIADTRVVSTIVAFLRGNLISVQVTTQLRVWGGMPLKERARRFFSRFTGSVLPLLLVLGVTLFLYPPPLVSDLRDRHKGQGLALLLYYGVSFVCGAAAILLTTFKNIRRDYPADWTRSQRWKLYREKLVAPGLLFFFPFTLSFPMPANILGEDGAARTPFLWWLIFSLCAFVPAILFFLGYSLKRAFWPIDCPTWASPPPALFTGTHQAVMEAAVRQEAPPLQS